MRPTVSVPEIHVRKPHLAFCVPRMSNPCLQATSRASIELFGNVVLDAVPQNSRHLRILSRELRSDARLGLRFWEALCWRLLVELHAGYLKGVTLLCGEHVVQPHAWSVVARSHSTLQCPMVMCLIERIATCSAQVLSLDGTFPCAVRRPTERQPRG
eukprot:CAMPEP_0115578966 /NCGR_PEP_ID=MMETSP0272-20121206/3865_1 /TAXON_ID=71861 /ORGANISM="Scrippsiella trochoidea, Strain CCMP3099" /LENGTH=156 /DNA_ID=CAMNT_0003013835 /DNA_START=560 /DNA_END=1030 /DNA_ORIENTATION=+